MSNPTHNIFPWLRLIAWQGLLAVMLSLVLTSMGLAVDKSWNAGDGSWYAPGNWTPNGVPNGDEFIRIGNLPGVQNSTVTLTAPGSGYDFLEISDGMTLDMNGGELVSFEDAFITGANSRLIVRPAVGPNMADFQGVLHVGAGAHFEMRDNAPVRIFGASRSSGTVSGRGEILVSSFTPFRNDGIIDPEGNGGIVLTQGNPGNLFPIDLDGLNGNGQLLLSTLFSELEVNASSLADPFDGTIFMGTGAALTMNITEGWVALTNSEINVGGSNNPAAASQIAGSEMTFAGTINVGGAQGHLRVLAPATFLANANVNVGVTDALEFDGATIVEGGQFTLSPGGQLDFDGPTTVHGGAFATGGVADGAGLVVFNGPTEWRGTVNINGRAWQKGDVTVTAPTVINANLFDMSGEGSQPVWDVESSLVLNVDDVSPGLNEFFNGEMNIGGSVLSRFTINFSGVDDQVWIMNGELNLAGNAIGFVPRMTGSPFAMSGEMNLSNSKIEITNDAFIFPDGVVSFAAPTTELRMRGRTVVREGATFNGEGTLINGVGGELVLQGGVTLDEVGVNNQGLFSIRGFNGVAGIASVDRFTNDDNGTMQFRLGGHVLGDEFDHLSVTDGPATLDGLLDVLLFDNGAGLFLPQVGDEFTILTALGGVAGQFLNSPVSSAAGMQFHWLVEYNPSDVTLVLESITVPEPGSAILMIMAFVAFWRESRRESKTAIR